MIHFKMLTLYFYNIFSSLRRFVPENRHQQQHGGVIGCRDKNHDTKQSGQHCWDRKHREVTVAAKKVLTLNFSVFIFGFHASWRAWPVQAIKYQYIHFQSNPHKIRSKIK